ncbi:hypothetical protein SAMN05216436_115124 [bacterium A37T11]|nr:hypothetical protein SAMN05216436_115124 [bacterium A37T11]
MNNDEMIQKLVSNLDQLNVLLDRFERKINDSEEFNQVELVPMADQLLAAMPDDLFRLLAQDHPLLRQMLQKFGSLFTYLRDHIPENVGRSGLKSDLVERSAFIQGLINPA